MKIIFSEKVTDISGKLLLTNIGKIYDITDLSIPVKDFKDISKISCGEEHFAALSPDGMVSLWGSNQNGECANKDVDYASVQTLDFKVINISAGNGTTIIQSEDKKVYVVGNNGSGELGLNDTASTYEIKEIDVGTEIENISCRMWNTYRISRQRWICMAYRNKYKW